MTYYIQKEKVSLKVFSHELSRQIMDALEKFAEMDRDDIVACEDDIDEIHTYVVDELWPRLRVAQDKVEELECEPYERLTGHEMGVCMGRV